MLVRGSRKTCGHRRLFQQRRADRSGAFVKRVGNSGLGRPGAGFGPAGHSCALPRHSDRPTAETRRRDPRAQGQFGPIIAVFAVWYDLCDPFVVLLRNEQLGRLSVAADWMERVARFAVLLFGLKSLQNVWQVDFSGALTGAGLAIVS